VFWNIQITFFYSAGKKCLCDFHYKSLNSLYLFLNHKTNTVKILFTLIAGSLIFFSCAKKITQPEPPPAPAVNQVVPPADTPKEVAKKMEGPEVVAGKQTFTTKCARCHGLKEPANFTAQEWVPIMDRMAIKANLDAAEKTNVLAYVSFHAKAN
jgi:cytochrome c5